MKGRENLKAMLRRVACIARIKGVSFEQVQQCVNYGFHTIGDPDGKPMVPDADELHMVFFENRLDQAEFFDVVQRQYGLPKPACVSNFFGLNSYCLLPETSEINRKNLLEEAVRLEGKLTPSPGDRQDSYGQLDLGDYYVVQISGTQSWMATVSSRSPTEPTGTFETEELALSWANEKSMETMQELWNIRAQTIYLQTTHAL